MALPLDLSHFLRRAHPNKEGCAELTGRQIYILPTLYGVLYGLLVCIMLLGSINSANNLGYLLTFLLVGLGLIAILHTWHNLLGLRVQPGHVKPVFAGQEAQFHIRAENQRNSPRPGMSLELAGQIKSSIDLESQGSDLLLLTVPAPDRGILKAGRFTLSTRFPLGLLRAWTYIDLDISCLVYPKPGPRIETINPPSRGDSATGDRGVGTDDFAGLREFRQGDPPRHIDWKAAARGKGLKTKLFGGDRTDQRWLDWDAMPEIETEARLGRLCRGVLSACEQQYEYGLRLPGITIKPARGQIHRHQCLAALARFNQQPTS
ncbi:FIG002343: hypothetical protein [hydrothermal vent metagenome]|uniref:Uncharacterized protein n=1 Tax=hydrothermal vent metagenome TaxID=652676 RepID=A0A3B1B6A6_9ZZZZ